MRKANHSRRTKALVMLIALVLVCCAAVGTTLAWLTDKTDPVVNTFTTSDIQIELNETLPTDKTAQMIPGFEIPKDPTVKVLADSEDCYLFVKIDTECTATVDGVAKTFDDYIDWDPASGWIELTEDNDGAALTGVYYRIVNKSTEEQPFPVLAGDKVTVNASVTAKMMEALDAEGAVAPKLTFTAYAVQYYASAGTPMGEKEAWAQALTLSSGS